MNFRCILWLVQGQTSIKQALLSVLLGCTVSNANDGAMSLRLFDLLRLPAGDPEEKETVILQNGDVEFSHLIVSQCAVGQLHVDVPGRVSHHHGKLTQDGNIQVADIAADPLQIKTQKTLL